MTTVTKTSMRLTVLAGAALATIGAAGYASLCAVDHLMAHTHIQEVPASAEMLLTPGGDEDVVSLARLAGIGHQPRVILTVTGP